jgi:hypothetical protein
MDRYYDNEWGRKGATISDKTARLEYGLTQDEIYDAIDAGKLQYRPAAMHGNPWLRLLRREVDDLARTLLLDGAQDSDGGSLRRHWGCRWGVAAEPAGGGFVGGGTWPMTMQ